MVRTMLTNNLKNYLLTAMIALIFSGIGGAVGWTWSARSEYITKTEASEMITQRFLTLKDYLRFFEERLSTKLFSIDTAIGNLEEKRDTKLDKLDAKRETRLILLEERLETKLNKIDNKIETILRNNITLNNSR
uniref:Uncharacterized protein n=1 Tax=viral metagenome TaxID=1070528 RepID=A0A6M3LEC7_9ZZZZ